MREEGLCCGLFFFPFFFCFFLFLAAITLCIELTRHLMIEILCKAVEEP